MRDEGEVKDEVVDFGIGADGEKGAGGRISRRWPGGGGGGRRESGLEGGGRAVSLGILGDGKRETKNRVDEWVGRVTILLIF